jgi:hypothetical protein
MAAGVDYPRLDSAAIKPPAQPVRIREQFMSAFSPRPQSRPRSICERDHAWASTVREPAAATGLNCPEPVRRLELCVAANLPCPGLSTNVDWQNVGRVVASPCPSCCRSISRSHPHHSRLCPPVIQPQSSGRSRIHAAPSAEVRGFAPGEGDHSRVALEARVISIHRRPAHAALPADNQYG